MERHIDLIELEIANIDNLISQINETIQETNEIISWDTITPYYKNQYILEKERLLTIKKQIEQIKKEKLNLLEKKQKRLLITPIEAEINLLQNEIIELYQSIANVKYQMLHTLWNSIHPTMENLTKKFYELNNELTEREILLDQKRNNSKNIKEKYTNIESTVPKYEGFNQKDTNFYFYIIIIILTTSIFFWINYNEQNF